MLGKDTSIRHKMMRAIMLTSAAVLVLTFASYFVYELISYRHIALRQLLTQGKIIAANSTAALAFDSPEDANEILTALKAEEDITAACLYDENGILFSKYPATLSKDDFPVKPAAYGYQFTENYLEGFQPVEQNGKRLGTLYLKKSNREVYDRLKLYSLIGIFVLLICFLLAYWLSKRLQKKISNPIISLAVTARAISQHHDYTVRAVKVSNDELGFLTDAFNQMLKQIDVQSKEIIQAREAAQHHSEELEVKVLERTIEYKKQRDFIETVLEASTELITVYDKHTRLITSNKNFEQHYGLRKENVMGKTFIEIFPGSTAEFTQLQRALTGETIHNSIVRSGITGKYYDSFLIPLRSNTGEVYAVLVSEHDVTESVISAETLKETADQLQLANESLVKKNNELEQFAYVASHDLQEPLRKIQTFTEFVQRNYGDEEMAKKYLAKIEISATRMSSLIRDVLDYSRLSQLHETFVDTDLNVIMENIKSDFELLIDQKEAVIHHNDLPVIRGNRLQMHQLFANLISNALKFSKDHPQINITAAHVNGKEVAAYPELDHMKNYSRLTVSDNGIGFEQQFAEKVFTIFQRLNTREKYEGTGIGLALCKKIVENHQGHIHVNSEPGKGTTFTIYLPLNKTNG